MVSSNSSTKAYSLGFPPICWKSGSMDVGDNIKSLNFFRTLSPFLPVYPLNNMEQVAYNFYLKTFNSQSLKALTFLVINFSNYQMRARVLRMHHRIIATINAYFDFIVIFIWGLNQSILVCLALQCYCYFQNLCFQVSLNMHQDTVGTCR